VVRRLLDAGARCTVTGRSAESLDALPFAERVERCVVDVTDEGSVTDFFAARERVDASIHVVGGFTMAPIEDTPLSDLERMFRLNTASAFLCCREAVRRMRESGGGRIVNVSARPAVEPAGGVVAYAASKAAVASLTQGLAEEVRDDGILVNAVLPSTMDTPTNRESMPDADFDRWPRVEEVAEAIAFLAGPENTLTSGALLPVYGRA
jgi:NAD(P)-dependent dehydrogenase (short-subunit alcohol dehydrogenase family)